MSSSVFDCDGCISECCAFPNCTCGCHEVPVELFDAVRSAVRVFRLLMSKRR